MLFSYYLDTPCVSIWSRYLKSHVISQIIRPFMAFKRFTKEVKRGAFKTIWWCISMTAVKQMEWLKVGFRIIHASNNSKFWKNIVDIFSQIFFQKDCKVSVQGFSTFNAIFCILLLCIFDFWRYYFVLRSRIDFGRINLPIIAKFHKKSCGSRTKMEAGKIQKLRRSLELQILNFLKNHLIASTIWRSETTAFVGFLEKS